MANQGYYGGTYDRYVSSNSEPSTISKMKETYWTTKQAVMTKLGKKQDEHVVASDAELDAKLELFRSIEQSCLELLRVIEKYQDRLCVLSREENAMGRLLKASSENDKTRAGKMMAAVGKAQNYSSQQLLQLRAPLVRLYQEVEVFRHRAVSDTALTVDRMEAARTEYRGALLWMKDVSEVLDPDTSKQLQKFRMVQAQVKKTKAKFDRLKLDTMQKVDLLAASRCNMFSQVLVKYQSTLLTFWEKTSYRMTAVADGFKGYQYYEFNMLKELGEPSKKLAEETSGGSVDKTLDDAFDDSHPSGILPRVPAIPKAPGTLLPMLDQSADNEESVPSPRPPQRPTGSHSSHHAAGTVSQSSHTDRAGTPSDNKPSTASLQSSADAAGSIPPAAATQPPADDVPLIDLDGNSSNKLGQQQPQGGSLTNLLDTEGGAKLSTATGAFMEFDDDDDVDIDELKRKQDEEFDFSSFLKNSAAGKKQNKNTSQGPMDLLSRDIGELDFEMDKDDATLLSEILNTPAMSSQGTGLTGSEGAEFSSEWQAAFGGNLIPSATAPSAGSLSLIDTDSKTNDFFMPSSLLDMTPASGAASGNIPLLTAPPKQTTQRPVAATSNVPKPKKKDAKAEMSTWFNLFAELDPLSNPDAIGRTKDDLTDA